MLRIQKYRVYRKKVCTLYILPHITGLELSPRCLQMQCTVCSVMQGTPAKHIKPGSHKCQYLHNCTIKINNWKLDIFCAISHCFTILQFAEAFFRNLYRLCLCLGLSLQDMLLGTREAKIHTLHQHDLSLLHRQTNRLTDNRTYRAAIAAKEIFLLTSLGKMSLNPNANQIVWGL